MYLEKIAHRGFSSLAPENTYSAFVEALKYGASGVEFDVHLSLDNIPIIIHDSTLERTTNGQGKVREKTVTELKELDAGSWFHRRFQGEKIPTFEEILDFLIPTGLKIYAEIKETNHWQINDLKHLINLIISKKCLNQCSIISFDANFLQQIREENLNITLGYLSKNITEYQEKLSYVKNELDVVLCHHQVLLENPQIITEAKNQKIKLIGWTIDDPNELNNLVKLGLESIITNSLLP
jgi:glycerophosphoryl diester phosphodiesterase